MGSTARCRSNLSGPRENPAVAAAGSQGARRSGYCFIQAADLEVGPCQSIFGEDVLTCCRHGFGDFHCFIGLSIVICKEERQVRFGLRDGWTSEIFGQLVVAFGLFTIPDGRIFGNTWLNRHQGHIDTNCGREAKVSEFPAINAAIIRMSPSVPKSEMAAEERWWLARQLCASA